MEMVIPMRTTAFLALLPLALVACKDGSTEDTADTTTTDTADTSVEDTGQAQTEVNVPLTVVASELPMGFTLVTAFLTAGDPEGCPSVATPSESVTVLTGQCETEDGTPWTGKVTLTETSELSGRLVYEGFGTGQITLDGEVVIADSGVLTANLEAVVDDGSTAVTFAYADYGVDSWASYSQALFGEVASPWTYSGTLYYGGTGGLAFTASGSGSNSEACDQEFDAAELTLSSTQGDLVLTQSSAACDGCTAWTWQDESGTACQ